MTRQILALAMLALSSIASADAQADTTPPCKFSNPSDVEPTADGVKLIARLANPPHTRVTLSIDGDNGGHFELIWDPAVGDGLQQTLLLPKDVWHLSPSIAQDRIVSDQLILLVSTTFIPDVRTSAIAFKSKQQSQFVSIKSDEIHLSDPADTATLLHVECVAGNLEMGALTLDPRRAAAASTARGLLDHAVPAPLGEGLSLLAEIAIERGKAGAMRVLKDNFVSPICKELTLNALKLGDGARALPRACELLEKLRLEDVLSSGKSLMAAVRDDVRLTLGPALISKVGLGPQTRGIAELAMGFANRVIAGETSQIVELDLLIAMLDRLIAFDELDPSVDVLRNWLAGRAPSDLADLKREILGHLLPADFDAIPEGETRPWDNLTACTRNYTKKTGSPSKGELQLGYYDPVSRADCLDALIAQLHGRNWIDVGIAMFSQDFVRRAMSTLVERANSEELLRYVTDKVLLPHSRDLYCASRVVIAVTKWCSSRDRCSAGDIAGVIDRPQNVFSPSSSSSLDSLCWDKASADARDWLERLVVPYTGGWIYRAFDNKTEFIELATRLVSFLSPVPKGGERARTLAMVHWTFDLLRVLNRRGDRLDRLRRVEEIVTRLLDGDYVRALTESLALASSFVCPAGADPEDCKPPKGLEKAAQFVGAIGSYMQTYEDTKALDPAEARRARKQAIESLIHAATDRHDRGGNWVWSIGSPVGFSVGARWAPAGAENDFDRDLNFGWRVPLALSLQRLPKHRPIGLHFALWMADLGQFARTSNGGEEDEITWKDFLGIGAQVGFLFGRSDHAVAIALEGSWSPGLYERSVMVGGETRHAAGLFTLGATVAYYVPFFDLN